MCWVGGTYLWAKSYHMMKCWAESLEYLRSHNPTSIGFRFACSQQAATATSAFRTFCACNQIEQFIRWHASRHTHVLLKACFVQWHTAMVWRTQDPAIVATSDTFPGCILFQTIPCFFFSARLLCCIMLLLIGPYQKQQEGNPEKKSVAKTSWILPQRSTKHQNHPSKESPPEEQHCHRHFHHSFAFRNS